MFKDPEWGPPYFYGSTCVPMAKRKVYTGSLEDILGNQILLNISKLKDGTYILKIMDENRVIKEITFIKTDTPKKP